MPAIMAYMSPPESGTHSGILSVIRFWQREGIPPMKSGARKSIWWRLSSNLSGAYHVTFFLGFHLAHIPALYLANLRAFYFSTCWRGPAGVCSDLELAGEVLHEGKKEDEAWAGKSSSATSGASEPSPGAEEPPDGITQDKPSSGDAVRNRRAPAWKAGWYIVNMYQHQWQQAHGQQKRQERQQVAQITKSKPASQQAARPRAVAPKSGRKKPRNPGSATKLTVEPAQGACSNVWYEQILHLIIAIRPETVHVDFTGV